MPPNGLTKRLKEEAARLGFSLAGVCPAVAPPGVEQFRGWLASGYAGQMHYLSERPAAYERPESVLDGARSILMLTMNYRTVEPVACETGQGRVSRYAWGNDYHDVIRERLHQLADYLRVLVPGANARGVVDTAPLLERDFARLAGLGWIGKNTLLLNRDEGSWFFLAALLTDQLLTYDEPHDTDHCGTCRACLDACPTNAFVDEYVLDATRCISYLTIELRESIPRDLREGMGDWLFGCDVCQDVCPWNSKAPAVEEADFAPVDGMNPVELAALFDLDDEAFRSRFKHTPLWRPKRRGLLRNAAIVLGNQRAVAATDGLAKGLSDAEPLVRGACAWALGELATQAARDALVRRSASESDKEVRREIAEALKHVSSTTGRDFTSL